MTRTEPLRRMILQLRQIFLIDALTFMLLPQNKKPVRRRDKSTSLHRYRRDKSTPLHTDIVAINRRLYKVATQ
jgi:hypothetical protein